MRAVLKCDLGEVGWDTNRLRTRIAGLTLLQRHLMAYREVGLPEIELWTSPDDRVVESIFKVTRVPGIKARVVLIDKAADAGHREPLVEQRADTLVDPRLLARVIEQARVRRSSVVCVDSSADNYPIEEKSPYRVGTPGADEVREATESDGTLHPVGLAVRQITFGQAPARLHVGRYYWHRIRQDSDRRPATRKVFLATMKPTDGLYARTNRRVSIPISTVLADTGITPNMVTLLTLGVSALAGVFFALGQYGYMLAGSFLSWFASMLDGVDGELARARFQASQFGAWLEMVCDYFYYIFILTGAGVGVYQQTSNPMWAFLGVGSAVGVILSFFAVARWRIRYLRRADRRDPGLAFQQTVGSSPSNPAFSLLRQCTFLATRAALPYYIVLFALFGIVDVLLILTFVGAHLVWVLVFYVSRTPIAGRREG